MLGGVYVWKPSSVPDLEKPRGHIDGYSRIRWCTDDKHFLWVGRTTALWGSVDDDSADVIASGESRIHDFAIAQQPRELLLFVDDGVLIFKRQLSLWGIPLHTFSLPPFEERPQEF